MPIDWPFPFGDKPISLRQRFGDDFTAEQYQILAMMARFAMHHLNMIHVY
jgi:hypothetical protein